MITTALARMRYVLLGLLAFVALGLTPAAAQTGEVDIEVFYRELEPHGRWIDHERYGEVWVPDVERGWRPYTRGQWVSTEEHGWYWESEEPFGWAVYHYGRWHLDDREGWVWVPGTEWGPAWVAWRHSDEAVGWAPLPPEAEWRDGEIGHAASFYDSPRFSPAWCFVPVALLTAPRIYSHVVTPRRNAYYLGRTRFVPWHRTASPHHYNGGFDRRRWESITGRRVEVRRVVAVDRPFREFTRGGRGGDVRVYRPRVVGLPRDDGRPGFRPPVLRREDGERRNEPGVRGRVPNIPRVERDIRPHIGPPVVRREQEQRPNLERPGNPGARPGRPSEPPRVETRDRPTFDAPTDRRRDPGGRRIDMPMAPEVKVIEPRSREPGPGNRQNPAPVRPPDDRRPQGGPPNLRDGGGRGGASEPAPSSN